MGFGVTVICHYMRVGRQILGYILGDPTQQITRKTRKKQIFKLRD